MLEAYLDIETTGLSPAYDDITVIGIYLTDGSYQRFVQLVGEEVTRTSLLEALQGVDTIYTYNGSGFDLPFINALLGVDLTKSFIHRDLMLDCWKNNLYGGFKAVEIQLGITRQLKDVNGEEAVRLWWRYQNYQDQNALHILLDYNKEDVVNLKTLREILDIRARRLNMDILVREKGGKEWKKVREQKFENEVALQDVLYQSPEIIPVEKLGENLLKPKLFIKEAGLPGSGYTDLIGIDEQGGITIIECKLATNTDIRRKVIGQVLEYAAYLWQMDYDQFDSICCKAEGWVDKDLAGALQEKMREMEKVWRQEDFRSALTSTLKKGDFRLIIAVDALNDELRRIIQFLNSRGEGSPQIHALEMKQFKTPELEMLVPELFGAPSPPPDGMDEQKFIRGSSERCKQLYYRLKELAKCEEFKTSSFTKRGFAFRYHERKNLFVLYPDWLEMWFGPAYPEDFLDKETDKQFWSMVSHIPVFESKMDTKNPVVVVNDETWKQEHVNTFVTALELLRSRLGQP